MRFVVLVCKIISKPVSAPNKGLGVSDTHVFYETKIGVASLQQHLQQHDLVL
jgi:hypothetical protein